MRRFIHIAIAFVALGLSAAIPSAAARYSWAVKYVCGYNPSNVGMSQAGERQGEPTVKFGNYATDINIYNPSYFDTAGIRKKVLYSVKEGYPEGREPKFQAPVAFDGIELPPMTATMDDCNRIAELIYGGAVPTPMPLWIGFLVIESEVDLDVTAVYTAETCSYWSQSTERLDCLDPDGRFQGVGISIDVDQIKSRKFE